MSHKGERWKGGKVERWKDGKVERWKGGKSRKIFSPMKRAYPNQYKNMFIFLKTI